MGIRKLWRREIQGEDTPKRIQVLEGGLDKNEGHVPVIDRYSDWTSIGLYYHSRTVYQYCEGCRATLTDYESKKHNYQSGGHFETIDNQYHNFTDRYCATCGGAMPDVKSEHSYWAKYKDAWNVSEGQKCAVAGCEYELSRFRLVPIITWECVRDGLTADGEESYHLVGTYDFGGAYPYLANYTVSVNSISGAHQIQYFSGTPNAEKGQWVTSSFSKYSFEDVTISYSFYSNDFNMYCNTSYSDSFKQ